MEVNVDNMVLALMGKIETEKFSSDTANAEKCLLAFKTELYMKRVCRYTLVYKNIFQALYLQRISLFVKGRSQTNKH